MFRWWFVTVPLVLVTVAAAAIVSERAQPEFTARGSMILVVPSGPVETSDADDVDVVNPLLSQNGALPTTAYVSALSMNSPNVASLLATEGLSTSYDVAAETRLPIILIETRARSRELATNTALRLVELIDEDLAFQQDAAVVPADRRVTADVISVAIVGGADYGGRTRLRIVILGLGMVMTTGLAFLLEGLARRRSRVRSGGDGRADAGVGRDQFSPPPWSPGAGSEMYLPDRVAPAAGSDPGGRDGDPAGIATDDRDAVRPSRGRSMSRPGVQ